MKNEDVSGTLKIMQGLIDLADRTPPLPRPLPGAIDLSLPNRLRVNEHWDDIRVWRNVANGWLRLLSSELRDRGYHVEEHAHSDTPLTVGPDIVTITISHFTVEIRRSALYSESSPFVLVTSSPTDGDKDRWASSPSRSVTSREAIMYLDGLRLGVQG